MANDKSKTKKDKAPSYKNPARYRLDFIKENTLNTLWSVRMTRTRVWIASLASAAAIVALLWAVVAFTPLRQLLPGALRGDLRAQYLETSLRIDSLEQAVRINDAYITNLLNALEGPADTANIGNAPAILVPDSLLAASEAEKQFVRSYEEEERFNLSVLAPIAAEGMVFAAPVAAAASVVPSPGIKGTVISSGTVAPVTSVYRGTVISSYVGPDGLSTVTVQHPNDFISVYGGLSDVFVDKGDRVSAAQCLGHLRARGKLTFELWHKGSPLDPRDYIAI